MDVADIGEMDRLIDLQRATESTNAANEVVKTFATLVSVWASAIPTSDSERARAGEVMSQIDMRFRIWYSSTVANLDTRDRIVFDSRTYDIVGVKEIGRKMLLEISASARAERA
jgi:SPP1 family predicted phage head-tail adaptor